MKFGLRELLDGYGLTAEELMADSLSDSIVPAICTECGAIHEYEPDCSDGYCDVCERNTVQSGLILMGII